MQSRFPADPELKITWKVSDGMTVLRSQILENWNKSRLFLLYIISPLLHDVNHVTLMKEI